MANTFSWTTTSTGGSWGTGASWTDVSSGTAGPPTSASGDFAEILVRTTIAAGNGTGAGSLLVNNTSGSGVSLLSVSTSSIFTITNAGTIQNGKLNLASSNSEASFGTLLLNGGTIAIGNASGTLAVGSGGFTESSGTFSPTKGVLTDSGALTVSGGTFSDNAFTTITGLTSFTGGTDSLGGANSPAISLGGLSVSGTNLTLNNGVATVTNGTTIASTGTLTMSGGTLVASATGVSNAGVISGFGLFSGANGGAITGTGKATATGGTLEFGASATQSGGFTIANATTNILKFDGAESNASVTFAGTTGGILELTPSSAAFNTSTIVSLGHWGGAANTDVINIQGSPVTSAKLSGNSLTITEADSTVTTITLVTPGGSNASWRADQGVGGLGGTLGGYDVFLACYAEGTRIATPAGEVAVENLLAGDLVTVLSGDRQVATPVKWLGYRRLDITAHPRPELVAPVRIRRGAFGENMPHRDLVLSPDHCVFVDGKLIPAKLLINDMTVVQDRETRAITYYHVELDRHAVLLAEGLPAESYMDTGNRAFFSNAGLALVLHPEFQVNAGLRCWETDACAPLAVNESAVEPVWRRLAERAEALGYERSEPVTTGDADLHLVADGRTVRPVSVDGSRHMFVLPRGASSVRLASRAGAPADLVPYLEDWRRLGVAVSRIVVRSAQEQSDIPADHPALSRGWHAVEREGGAVWRWTDGNATLPIVAGDMPLTVEVHVRQSMTYRLTEAAVADRLVA